MSQRQRLAALGRRARQVILMAAVTGIVTGAAVAGFEWATRRQLADRLLRAPEPVQLVAPVIGLLVAALLLRRVGRNATPSTADEYIQGVHSGDIGLDLRAVVARVLASIATLGSGGALGYEGPSIYMGAVIGGGIQRRLARLFGPSDAGVLLVAGAAAGVAAIFKAPATGLVFALEVPYQDDFARHMLLPAGIAAATSYVTFAAFRGTAPLLHVGAAPPFDLRDIMGAVALGALCGIGARLFTFALGNAKRVAARAHPILRALVGGAGLSALVAISHAEFGRSLTLGAGYDSLSWALDAKRAAGLVLLLFILRAVATVLTVAGGGVGGLFIPLVIEGALLGRAFGGVVGSPAGGLFPLIGVAAFLGAGYRVPLAAVVFMAEATGRPGFIVPGMIAAIVAQLFMGGMSASAYQQPARYALGSD